MGIGPVPAIRRAAGARRPEARRHRPLRDQRGLRRAGLAVERELGLDHAKVNVNGGAIAIGHPLAATGVRLTVTLARELRRRGLRYGVSSACVGGGQGIALVVETPDVTGQAG